MGIWKDRLKRYARNAKNRLRHGMALWIPAAAVVLVLSGIMYAVATSEDGAFRQCSEKLVTCMRDDAEGLSSFEKSGKFVQCSYQTAWCDVTVLWNNAWNKPENVGKPLAMPQNEAEIIQNQKELLEYLISDQVLEERSEQIQQELTVEEKAEEQSAEELKTEMERLRRERKEFETDRKKFRQMMNETKDISGESLDKDDILSGQKTK